MLQRYPDWPTRLDQYLLQSLTRRFRYGQMDCALFVADAVLVMTGTDIAEEFRGRYASHTEALLLSEAYCGRQSVRALVESSLTRRALPQVHPLLAQRGDVVLLRKKHLTLGLLAPNGRQVLVAAKTGCVKLPLACAERAWRI